MQQRQRQVQLLASAAREVLDAVVQVLGEGELVQESLARASGPRTVEGVRLGEELEVLGDCELVPEQWHLRAVTEPRGTLDRAGVARQQADDYLHQDALARAVLTHEAHELARLDMQ